jgi:hypothetical protein
MQTVMPGQCPQKDWPCAGAALIIPFLARVSAGVSYLRETATRKCSLPDHESLPFVFREICALKSCVNSD